MAVERTEAHPFILTVLLTGIFLGFGVSIWFGLKTFMLVDEMLNIFLIGGLAALAFYYLFLRKWNRFLIEIVAYSFLGWGNIVLGIFLSMNFLFHHTIQNQVYELEKNIFLSPAYLTEIQVIDNDFDNYRHMLRFDENEIQPTVINGKPIVKKALFTTAQGLFGYKVLIDKKLFY